MPSNGAHMSRRPVAPTWFGMSFLPVSLEPAQQPRNYPCNAGEMHIVYVHHHKALKVKAMQLL